MIKQIWYWVLKQFETQEYTIKYVSGSKPYRVTVRIGNQVDIYDHFRTEADAISAIEHLQTLPQDHRCHYFRPNNYIRTD